MKKRMIFAGLLAALIAATPARAQQLTKVSIAQPVLAAVSMPMFYARDAGIFKKNGLEVDLPMFRGGPAANAALLSGSVEFVAADPYEFMKIADTGKVTRVLTVVHSLTVDLVASNAFIKARGIDPSAPARDRIAKMKGMKFGSIVAGGSSEGFARLMFKHGGLDPEKDMERIQAGGTAQLLGAMQAGQIDAFILSPPSGVSAERLGIGRVLVAAKEIPDFDGILFTGIQSRGDYIKANPGIVSRLVKSVVEAQKLVAQNPAEAAKILKAGGFADFNESDLEATIRVMGESFRPRPQSLADWKRTQDFFRQAVADPSIAQVEMKEEIIWTNKFVEDALR